MTMLGTTLLTCVKDKTPIYNYCFAPSHSDSAMTCSPTSSEEEMALSLSEGSGAEDSGSSREETRGPGATTVVSSRGDVSRETETSLVICVVIPDLQQSVGELNVPFCDNDRRHNSVLSLLQHEHNLHDKKHLSTREFRRRNHKHN